jgi:lipopolysaccharide/colanic/teichoic acid biosynthesis glycosyltransferase
MNGVKRLVDIIGAVLALVVFGPVIAVSALTIWLHDRHTPLFCGLRVGRGGIPFKCIKLRTMTIDADRTKVDTTVSGDPRIIPVGRRLRRYKLDELPQFWNVLKGDMSLVGPRPNVPREVELYTAEERRMLALRPGITDFSSIIFSDLGEILAGSKDPNLDYNQLVRPWKSRLILHYLDHESAGLDMALLMLTALGILSGTWARRGVILLRKKTGATPELIAVARRSQPLVPTPPPGADAIVLRQ